MERLERKGKDGMKVTVKTDKGEGSEEKKGKRVKEKWKAAG